MGKEIKERKIQIYKLQSNLASIRKIAGWTAEILGNKIGVTKQTISNLENKKTPMNFMQYIAIRSVLDAEIENHDDSGVLSKVITILLDSEDNLEKDEYQEVRNSVETVAATAAGGVAGASLLRLLGAISPIAISSLGSKTAKNWKKILK